MALATELSKILTSNKKMVGLMALNKELIKATMPGIIDSDLTSEERRINTEKQVMSALYDIR